MADYDVSVIGLTVPAATAPLAQCRPVVSVRNNGLHDAVASGYIRIYSAGLLIFESELYSDTIGPGLTRPASAVDYWTPPAEGTYTVQGYVSCPLDQVEPNNNLFPTTIVVSGTEPEPPTPVQAHASQHESGGADELSIEGLPGRAADDQTPITHATNHMNAGIDRLDVTGLPGILGEAQNPKLHAAAHKIGGADLVDVLGLPNATALELVARKGVVNGYAELDSGGLLPITRLCPYGEQPATNGLRKDRSWGPVDPTDHTHLILDATGAAASIGPADPDTQFASITIPEALKTDSLSIHFKAFGRLTQVAKPAAFMLFRFWLNAFLQVEAWLDCSAAATGRQFTIEADFWHIGSMTGKGAIRVIAAETSTASFHVAQDNLLGVVGYNLADLHAYVSGQWSNPHLSDICTIDCWRFDLPGQPT
jgi:hypothetical protein